MESEQVLTLEKALRRIVRLTLCMQGLWIAIFAGLYFLCSGDFYPKYGQLLSVVAFISPFAMSSIYIKKGKELEEIKTLSPKERKSIKREFFISFVSLYPLWVLMFIYFS